MVGFAICRDNRDRHWRGMFLSSDNCLSPDFGRFLVCEFHLLPLFTVYSIASYNCRSDLE